MREIKEMGFGSLIKELIHLSQMHFPVGMSEGVWKRNVVPILKRKKLIEKELNKRYKLIFK